LPSHEAAQDVRTPTAPTSEEGGTGSAACDRTSKSPAVSLGRRGFLGAGGVAAAMLILPRRAHASASPRSLAFRHTHTQERLAVTYAIGDRYAPDALDRVAQFLRDFRNGETHAIDPALLDELHALTSVTAGAATIDVISGYRSPATNRMLHERSHGVATQSLHLEGRAIDIRVAGVRLADLRDAALSLRAGGVGYYPASDFVHVDTGRVRRW
jgi:uncharacterized protein YcbK (DUF882 family)